MANGHAHELSRTLELISRPYVPVTLLLTFTIYNKLEPTGILSRARALSGNDCIKYGTYIVYVQAVMLRIHGIDARLYLNRSIWVRFITVFVQFEIP